MAKTKKEKDAEFTYQAMPTFVKYNNSLNIKTWITNFERKSDSYGLDHGWKVLHLSDYLQDEALTYYFESLCNIEDWGKLKESLIIRFQKVKLTPLVEMMRITQEEQETVTEYFHRKMQLINNVELNLTSIVELLNEGVKTKYKPYLATVDAVQPSEWLTMAIKVENSLTGSGTPVEKGRLQTLNPALHPSPRPAGYYSNSQVQRPPMPCRICERLGLELQWHYHSVCPYRNPTASRSFPPPTPRVQRPTASRSFPSASPHSYQAAASSSFPPPTPHDYQPTVASASSPDSPSEPQKQKLIDVLGKYKNIFAQYDLDVGLINTTPITFRLTTDTPIVQKPYRTSYANNTEINRQIHELLKYNIIRPSCSAYASPILLVQKKSDITGHPTRLCIDFRKLNLITKTENSPIPLIEEILDRLGNAKMFTSLDIKHAYWHIPIAETHKDKTAFVCQQGCYEWNRMPYGLKNGPSIFNRIIPNILQKFNIQYALNYFDDIIVFSKDFQDLQHLDHILNALKQENIKLNFNKCQFFQNEIHFLGYTIKNGTYTPSNANIEAIKKLYRPYNMKTLQSFLGSINVYHKFIPHYAQIRAPLNTLLQKNSPWQWNQEQEQSFQTLKNALMTKPILQLYDPQKPVHIFTDSSMLGVGAILKQPDKQGILHPVAYFSRKLHKYERNYAATELETLAIIAAIQRFHPYIHNIHFTLHTDHMPLKWLKTFKNPSGRIFRWSLLLTQYDFDIQHIKGSQNVEADMLSRRPITHFLNLTDIKQYQQQEDSSHNKYKTQNGLFVKTKRGFNRIYVPLKLRENLLEKVHTQFGHIGTTQMTKTIFPQYYWPNMTQDIVNYIRHCETCQINKSRDNRPIYGPLQALPTATEPYHIFSIDTLGGLHNSHNPQTNAKVERLNSTIVNRLRCKYNKHSNIPWTKHLPDVVKEYNSTPHTITGFTPMYLLLGIPPYDTTTDLNLQTYPPIEESRKLAIQRTHKSHENSKIIYDKTHPIPDFKIGDQVLVQTFFYPNTGKLTSKYNGPYTILKQLSPVTYEINRPNQPQKKQTEIIHANKLKHFHPSDNFKITHNMQSSSTNNQINKNADLIIFDSGRIFRWSLLLTQYDFDIQHIKGSQNVEADMLSRRPITHFLNLTDIKQYQQQEDSSHNKYKTQNGLFVKTKRGFNRIYVPLKLRENLLEKHNVKHLLTSSHNPQTNAKVERLNSTIVNRLRCKYNTHSNIPWTKHLPDVVKEYNSTPHTITGFTPMYLLLGIPPYDTTTDLNLQTYPPIEESRKLAIQRTHKSHENSKIIYDKTHPIPDFKIGDQVLVQTFFYPNTGKLTSKYNGPYTILKQLSPVTYEINRPNQPQKKQTEIIHANKLKHFHPSDNFKITHHMQSSSTNNQINKNADLIIFDSGRIFRWSLLLTQYDFDIQHIKGSQNVEADMLSRRPITHFLNLTDIKQYQQQEDSSHNKYKTQNGLFVKTKRGFNRIYVPLKLRENLLEKVHTQFGHIGTTQMTKTIFPQYYWPNMTQDIVNYIRHCETCQINKSRDNRPIYGPLQALPTATEPYHIFSIDTLGGLHNSHNPQTNAKVERLNSTIVNRLRCKYNTHSNIPWTKHLPDVVKEYNSTPHTITGFTPMYLLLGIPPYDTTTDLNLQTYPPIEESRKLAIQRTHKSHENSKIIYDKTHPIPDFKIGDQVLVQTFFYPNTGKLTSKYNGPYTILKQLSPVTYEINRPNQPQKKQTEIIHANKLKHFHPSDNFKITHHMQSSSTNNQINKNADLIIFDSGEPYINDCVSILDQDNPSYHSSNLLKPATIEKDKQLLIVF
ncbi:K02A2.6-like [Cordylochernes scorpioides]|uniref:RNA-directed DNA polymerase n=1 Tax=Cordylochernes scorpioides TaxID=51811 RepID=A0ABY6KC68_9ARAC|nr:K02A2.6-like [Cordylochernes scorpioides]